MTLMLWYISRWNIEMPTIIKGSISILSDAGLGMAMFSLGTFSVFSDDCKINQMMMAQPMAYTFVYYLPNKK